jgi:circadian clock protein KaiC
VCSALVIDSFRALRYQSRDEGEFEGFIHELARRLTATGTMALWLGEYSQDELASRPEFAIADAALVLATEENGQRESRALRVLKLRGSGFRSGAHAYRSGVDGVEVFPRLSDVDATRYELGRQRASSGIPALDREGGAEGQSVELIRGRVMPGYLPRSDEQVTGCVRSFGRPKDPTRSC